MNFVALLFKINKDKSLFIDSDEYGFLTPTPPSDPQIHQYSDSGIFEPT